jgi:hypothetical protein
VTHLTVLPASQPTVEASATRRRLSTHWAFSSFAVLGLLALTLWLRYTALTPTRVLAERILRGIRVEKDN